MQPSEKFEALSEELALFKNGTIKAFTKQCIARAPDYVFINCPASSSGKYHPADELGPDGTLKHTKKVVTLARELARGLGCEEHIDEIIAAAILHDLVKCGWSDTGHTVVNHPRLAWELVLNTFMDTDDPFVGSIDPASAKMIARCCLYHYGPWSEALVRKPIDDYTPEEMAVYMADYVASRKWITINQGGN